jgi:hypothetical protein
VCRTVERSRVDSLRVSPPGEEGSRVSGLQLSWMESAAGAGTAGVGTTRKRALSVTRRSHASGSRGAKADARCWRIAARLPHNQKQRG